MVADRLADEAEAVAAAARGAGGEAIAYAVDLTDLDEIGAMVDRRDRLARRASTSSSTTPASPRRARCSRRRWTTGDTQVDVNLRAPVLRPPGRGPAHGRSRAAARSSTPSRPRASLSSSTPAPIYDLTKGGLRQLTISAAVELAPHGVNVNGVAPGHDRHRTDHRRARHAREAGAGDRPHPARDVRPAVGHRGRGRLPVLERRRLRPRPRARRRRRMAGDLSRRASAGHHTALPSAGARPSAGGSDGVRPHSDDRVAVRRVRGCEGTRNGAAACCSTPRPRCSSRPASRSRWKPSRTGRRGHRHALSPFSQSHALVTSVAVDVMERTGIEARAALAEEPDGFAALRRYMHRALDVGAPAIMPLLDDEVRSVAGDEDAARTRRRPPRSVDRRRRAAGVVPRRGHVRRHRARPRQVLATTRPRLRSSVRVGGGASSPGRLHRRSSPRWRAATDGAGPDAAEVAGDAERTRATRKPKGETAV